MNILVDVNVFEDVFRQRQGWESSLAVLNCLRNGQAAGYVSALTPPILYFFRRRTRGEKAARQAVQRILQNWAVVPLTGDGEAIGQAYTAALPDFEDALQLEAAKTAHVDAIVTRNKKHFRQPAVRILSPEEFVEQVESTQKL
ncbi:MAG: PIN domain-containing protein [Terriglobia bacterium]